MKPILVLVGLSTASFFWEGGELESDVLVTEKKMKHEQLLQDTFLPSRICSDSIMSDTSKAFIINLQPAQCSTISHLPKHACLPRGRYFIQFCIWFPKKVVVFSLQVSQCLHLILVYFKDLTNPGWERFELGSFCFQSWVLSTIQSCPTSQEPRFNL